MRLSLRGDNFYLLANYHCPLSEALLLGTLVGFLIDSLILACAYFPGG